MNIPLLFHPTADAARQLGQGRNIWALVDSDGDTVDVVTGEELIELIEADNAEIERQYDGEAPAVRAGIL